MKKYFSFIKFSHTVFALPFAIIGYFLAVSGYQYTFRWSTFIPMVLCMVFARSSAMAFNRYIDKNIDKNNIRTASREIPMGVISGKQALGFVILMSLLFILSSFFINRLCFYLSPVALLIILGYSYTKRFTELSHFILGIGLSLAPIGAYIAVSEEFGLLPVIISLIVCSWVSGFDIIYSLQDEEYDKDHQLFSIPAKFGKSKALIISLWLHIITSLLVLLAGYYGGYGLWYWIGGGIFILLLIYQHSLVSPKDISKVNSVFFRINGIASIIFALFFLIELYVS